MSNKRMASVFYDQGSAGGFTPGTSLLVDIGVNGKEIANALTAIDESIMEVDGILLTHEHVDHMRGIGVVMRKHKIPLYVNQATWDRMQTLAIGPIPDNLIHIIQSGSEFEIGDMRIRSFRTPHDAVESVGYRITADNRSVSVFTDIGEIKEELLAEVSGSDTIFIESNYDYEMLWNGPYPWFLKKRIHGVNGHLSNMDCAQTIGSASGERDIALCPFPFEQREQLS